MKGHARNDRSKTLDVDIALTSIEYTSNPKAGIPAHAQVVFEYADTVTRKLDLCQGSNVPIGAQFTYRTGLRTYKGARRLQHIITKVRNSTNENYKDKTGEWQTLTEWHDIVAWRSLGERAESSLKKGMMVYVEGKLTHRTWQDQEGNNRRTTEVVANYFRIVSKKEGTGAGSGGSGYFPSSTDEMPVEEKASTVPTVPETRESGESDDLPF